MTFEYRNFDSRFLFDDLIALLETSVRLKMHTNAEISSALQQIELVKQAVEESNDPKLQMETVDDIKLILDILQDPIFRNIVHIQDSLSELNTQIAQHPSILPNDFDIAVSGDLILKVPTTDLFDGDFSGNDPDSPGSGGSDKKYAKSKNTNELVDQEKDKIDKTMSMLKKARGLAELTGTSNKNESTDDERPKSVMSDSVKAAAHDLTLVEWIQVQAIELVNDGTGLGFGIIGAKNSGVIVKTILPGGVADRDGRLLSGDHILQIGDVNLHEMVSEQVASVLRQSGTHVRLVVARPVDPLTSAQVEDVEGSAIVPSRLIQDPYELKRYLADAGYPEIFGASSTPSTPSIQNDHFRFQTETSGGTNLIDMDLPETERFTVELKKDTNGLGITIAGYVCEKEELSGIFVKSVSPGSAADVSGKIHVNDRIIEVDGQSLQGFSNHQAVDVLKQSGAVVRLCLERYLRGPKYEQLQQAIAANELKPSTPNTPPLLPPPLTHNSAARLASYNANSGSGSNLHEPFRKTSKQSLYDQSIFSQETSFSSIPLKKINNPDVLPQPPPPMTTFGTGPSTNRNKLLLARDSIEQRVPGNPLNGDEDEDDLAPESAVDDEDEPYLPPPPPISHRTKLNESPMMLIQPPTPAPNKYAIESKLTDETRQAIMSKWLAVLDPEVEVIVAQIRKFAASSGLGISLEGTVDVEGGREVRPHHYIRSILPEGPVGQNGLLRSGDELLEVNGKRLLGMNHLEVVSILKELPQDVRMVCCRNASNVPTDMVAFTKDNLQQELELETSEGGSSHGLMPTDRLVKAKSDGSLATGSGSPGDGFSKMKSRSLEPLTGLAMWSSETQIIELLKGERGLGFSILDYQDPLDPNDTLIVIRSLVPGGVAQIDGRLIPGDRLLFVNDTCLENASLDQAVAALKGAPKGIVRIGVAKPLPMADSSITFSDKSMSSMSSSAAFDSANLSMSAVLRNRASINSKPDIIRE
uniref:CSON006531 protein n=3 Tax=Culicoides sonorensis TaxID=179676 RepID=A0A336KF46_CULSO